MPAKVADASLVAAFAFKEPELAQATKLLRSGELYSPRLLMYELANIAVQKIRANPSQQAVLWEGFEIAQSLDINLVDPALDDVVRLATDTGLTAYDASYLYVARSMGIELVTFDRRLRAAAAANG